MLLLLSSSSSNAVLLGVILFDSLELKEVVELLKLAVRGAITLLLCRCDFIVSLSVVLFCYEKRRGQKMYMIMYLM